MPQPASHRQPLDATAVSTMVLLTKYLAGRLSAFSFLAPLFGVIAGVLVLGEPLRAPFGFAVALVGVGIYLVNRRRA